MADFSEFLYFIPLRLCSRATLTLNLGLEVGQVPGSTADVHSHLSSFSQQLHFSLLKTLGICLDRHRSKHTYLKLKGFRFYRYLELTKIMLISQHATHFPTLFLLQDMRTLVFKEKKFFSICRAVYHRVIIIS